MRLLKIIEKPFLSTDFYFGQLFLLIKNVKY